MDGCVGWWPTGARVAGWRPQNLAPRSPGPAQCDSRVGDSCVVSEVCMYVRMDGRLESIIPNLNFAPLCINTRWWRRALRARRFDDTQAYRPAKLQPNPSQILAKSQISVKSRRHGARCHTDACIVADPQITLCRPQRYRSTTGMLCKVENPDGC